MVRTYWALVRPGQPEWVYMGKVQARRKALVGSEKLPPTATGTLAFSLPLAEGVGELELAVVFIPFGSGTDDLDGVLGLRG